MITLLNDLLERPIKNGNILNNRYEIIRFIAKGSYGMVYQARVLTTDKSVVIKQLRSRKSKARKGLLEREADMLITLNHPAIPKWVDLFEENGASFLVMQYIEGKNVEELIFHHGRKYSKKESFEILLKVLEVIQYLHHKGIIHRDLRLPNILINANKLFVIDFGLAVFYHDKELDADASMPPEKKLYREIAYTSDFYALGHFVLFLLYSSYQPSSLKNQGWEDELTIGNQGLYIIRRLLKLDNGYENVNEIVADVEKALLTM